MIPNHDIEVYGRLGCDACGEFCEFLLKHEVPFIYEDMEKPSDKLKASTVASESALYFNSELPMIVVDGQIFGYAGGYDEIITLYSIGGLQ